MTDYASEFDSLSSTKSGKSSYAEDFDKLTPSKNKYEYDPKNNLGSDTQNFMAGAGKAVVDLGRGFNQLVDKGAVALGVPGSKRAQAENQALIDEARKNDEPLMGTKAGFAGNIAGNVATTLLPVGGAAEAGLVSKALVNPTTYKAAAGIGAAQGALEPTSGNESHIWNAGTGALTALGGNAAINTIGRIAQPIKNALSAAQNKAVSVLENAGIPLDAAQKTGSSFLNKLRSSFSDNPVTSGAQAELREAQQQGFNKAVLKTAGVDATAATPDVMRKASDNISNVFKDVLGRNNISMNDSILERVLETQKRSLEEEKKPIANIADRLLNSIGEGDTIPGQTAYNIKKDLDRLASSPDTTLAYHARQLRSTIMDATNDSLSDQDKQIFSQARQQFSNLKRIESTIDKEGSGDISPSKLANVMSQKANRQASVYGRGDRELVDLAHSGNMLLPDKNKNSGTTARLAMQYGLPLLAGAGAGTYGGSDSEKFGFDLMDAAKTVAAVVVAPKVAQKIMNNPTTAKYLSEGIQKYPLKDVPLINKIPGINKTPVRELLTLPEKNNTIGAMVRRLPLADKQTKKEQP